MLYVVSEKYLVSRWPLRLKSERNVIYFTIETEQYNVSHL